MWYDAWYILFDWKLGWWEIGAKIFVFQEIYETLLYLLAPFVLPISFATRPVFCSYLYAATIVLYTGNAFIFNYVSLHFLHAYMPGHPQIPVPNLFSRRAHRLIMDNIRFISAPATRPFLSKPFATTFLSNGFSASSTSHPATTPSTPTPPTSQNAIRKSSKTIKPWK